LNIGADPGCRRCRDHAEQRNKDEQEVGGQAGACGLVPNRKPCLTKSRKDHRLEGRGGIKISAASAILRTNFSGSSPKASSMRLRVRNRLVTTGNCEPATFVNRSAGPCRTTVAAGFRPIPDAGQSLLRLREARLRAGAYRGNL
jgi:hypothetical protein